MASEKWGLPDDYYPDAPRSSTAMAIGLILLFSACFIALGAVVPW